MLALAFLALHLAPTEPGVPLRAPQLAASPNLVALAYGAGRNIFVATSTDQGKHFSAAVKVAEVPILPLTRHRGPRIVFSNGALVVSAITGRVLATGPHAHGLPSDGDLFTWRSVDGGKTWSRAVRINDVPSAAREGLHTLAANSKGDLFAAWLDLREKGTRLFGAWSKDGGTSWSANALLYESPAGTICQCCHPFAAFTPSGTLEVMWRNVLDGARDLYLMRSVDGRSFSKPEKLGTGSWTINACPMDGGGLAHVDGRTISAWRRDTDIFLAEAGKAETRLAAGKDVAIAASGGRVYAAWVSASGLIAWIDGKRQALAPQAAFPALTGLPGGGVLAAWEEGGGISVVPLP